MVPRCDSLEGNAKSFGAKINKSEKICPFYQKQTNKQTKKPPKKQPRVVLHWQIEANFGQDGEYSGEGFCLVN